MKKAIFLLLAVVLLATVVSASKTTETLIVGQSFVLRDQNITLLDLDTKEDKVILCINGKKDIVADGKEKRVGETLVNVKTVSQNTAKIEFDSDCEDCILSNNNECLHTCNKNSDCNDNDESTIDSCIGTPRKCEYFQIEKEEVVEIVEEVKEHNIVVNIEEEIKEVETKTNFLTKFLDWLSSVFS